MPDIMFDEVYEVGARNVVRSFLSYGISLDSKEGALSQLRDGEIENSLSSLVH
jgi:hypothetical protein